MPYLRRMAILTAFAIGGAIAAVTVGALKAAFPAGRGQVQKDVALLADEGAAQEGELAPITDAELERMSWNILFEKKKGGVERGQITSVYHEPLVWFGFKKYWSPGTDRSVLYARSKQYEWIYQSSGKRVSVVVNGKPVGQLMPDGSLVDKKKRPLARLTRRPGQELWPITVGGTELGSLTNPKFKHSELARAFSFTLPMNHSQRGAFLAVAIYEMLVQR